MSPDKRSRHPEGISVQVISSDVAIGQCYLRKAPEKLFNPSTTDEEEGCSAASGDVASSFTNCPRSVMVGRELRWTSLTASLRTRHRRMIRQTHDLMQPLARGESDTILLSTYLSSSPFPERS